MEEETAKEKLRRLGIPDPNPESRDRALAAVKDEFDRLQEKKRRQSKGILIIGRLMGKIRKGGTIMRRSYAISAGFAAVLVTAMVIVILPSLQSYRIVDRSAVLEPAKRPMLMSESPAPGALIQEQRRLGDKVEAYAPEDSVFVLEEVVVTGEMLEEAVVTGADQTYVGRDRFETTKPNRMKLVSEEPVSTFSIDVDTAAYSFVRRALNSGVLPQKNAVRVEELINYFDYDYPLPTDRKVPFRPTVAVFPTPWNADTKLLHVGIKGYEIAIEERPRANLVLLIDVSGSMDQPDKLPLLKSAFRMLVGNLAPEDTVGIVVYAGAAGTVLEPTEAAEKGRILAAIDRLSAGGSTAGGEGVRRAYALAEMNYDPESVNRVILATDGDFNVGIRDPEELKGFVERKRETGIYLSVLGFGQGNYRDAMMQALAQNGNGNAAYIDNLNEARKVLVEEAGSTLFTIAKDVKIQIEFNPATIAEYRLIGYETRMLARDEFNDDRVDAGDVGAGHSVTAIYEIVPVDSKARLIDELRYQGSRRRLTDDLRYEDTKSSRRPIADSGGNEYAFLKIRYKHPDSDTSQLITTPVGKNDELASIDMAPADTRFAAAVAAFGQLLRGDSFVASFTYDDVLSLAERARGKDLFGYRTEFLNLVRLAKTARTMGDR